MPDKPDGPPPAVAGLIGQVLGFIDRPWKAVAVVVLFLIGGAGYVAYDKRDQLIAAWLTPAGASLRSAEVPHSIEWLAQDTGADLIEIWSGDLNTNTQRFIDARRRGTAGSPAMVEPRRLPIVVKITDARLLVDIISGIPICANITDHGAPIAQRLVARGIKHACAVPIPSSPDAFVGVIYLGWITPPEPAAEEVALAAAREIAGQLVAH